MDETNIPKEKWKAFNTDVNPLFVDSVNGNYNLQAGSPCIDAGYSNSPAPLNDKDGNTRYDDPFTPNTGKGSNGSYYDIGAYEYTSSITLSDVDGDGYYSEVDDCDDNEKSVNPGMVEICGDTVDQDCTGSDLVCPETTDNDGDGYYAEKDDCNDSNSSIYPGATEHCGDGIDQDCSGKDMMCPYIITEVLQGNGMGIPKSINNKGQIVIPLIKAAITPSFSTLMIYLWDNGVLKEIHTQDTLGLGECYINNNSQVAGNSSPYGNTFLLDNDIVTYSDKKFVVTAINNNGQVVGRDEGYMRGFIWENGSIKSFPYKPFYDINDNGLILGHGYVIQYSDGFLSNKNSIAGLKSGWRSAVSSLNNKGQVVGQSFPKSVGDNPRAFLWEDGVITALDKEADWDSKITDAVAINNNGLIIGSVKEVKERDSVPCLWKNGIRTELTELISPNSSWMLKEATDINDHGDIIGVDWQKRIFIMSPVNIGSEEVTLTGNNVEVVFKQEQISIVFEQVETQGTSNITTSVGSNLPPDGFMTLGEHYYVNTTATHSGKINICFNYDDSTLTTEQEEDLELFHYEDGKWRKIVTSINTDTNNICGNTDSLSEFIIARPKAEIDTVVPSLDEWGMLTLVAAFGVAFWRKRKIAV